MECACGMATIKSNAKDAALKNEKNGANDNDEVYALDMEQNLGRR